MSAAWPLLPDSSVVATALTLLFAVACAAFVLLVRRRTGRVRTAIAACLLGTTALLLMHHPGGAEWVIVWLALLVVCACGANAAAVAALVPWPERRVRRASSVGLVLLGGPLLVAAQVWLGERGVAAVSPWTFGVGPRITLTLENGFTAPASIAWREPEGETSSWLDVAPGETDRVWHQLLTSEELMAVARRHPIPDSLSGTLLVRVGDGMPLEAAVSGVPFVQHFAVRLDASGAAWLRSGDNGCFGAPDLGEERAFDEGIARGDPSDG
ncbi:MAG: hypothetical protein H6825_01540 [Planctomycetes bacterium]|nr:hypothetical protein [Planctomycetota bacterium]